MPRNAAPLALQQTQTSFRSVEMRLPKHAKESSRGWAHSGSHAGAGRRDSGIAGHEQGCGLPLLSGSPPARRADRERVHQFRSSISQLIVAKANSSSTAPFQM